jgi:hypothetical protein
MYKNLQEHNNLLKKQYLLKGLNIFGITGLYESQSISDQKDYENFMIFFTNLKQRLSNSPRNNILDEITKICNQLYDQHDWVKELYKYLGLSKGINYLIILEKFREYQPGKIYHDWSCFESKTQFTPLSSLEIETAIQNKKRKLETANTDYDFDSDQFIIDINSIKLKRCLQQKENAQVKLKELQTDIEYQNYLKVNKLWKEYGFDKFEEKYDKVNIGIGNDRRTRGDGFEEEFRVRSVENMKIALHKKLILDDHKVEVFYNCYWKDDKQKQMGEIDIVLLYNNEILAIGEQKTSYFDIVAGYHQHKKKIKENWIYIPQKGKFKVKENLEIFIITLIPENPHLIGTESKLVKMIGNSLSSIGFEYNESKSIENYKLHDFLEFKSQVKEKLIFSMSPDIFLEQYYDNIIIFDPYDKVVTDT